MTVKAVVGGIELEIWFTPSFNIKSTDKEFAHELRNLEVQVFDPHTYQRRKTRVSRSEWDAYLVLEALKINHPRLNITIVEHPEVETFPVKKTKELLN